MTEPPCAEAAITDDELHEHRARGRELLARDLALGGLMGALGLVLPMAFHGLGPGAGAIFLPMYLPVLTLAMLAAPRISVVVGMALPVVSSVLTGMPPLVPVGVIMVFELAALAGAAGLARSRGAGPLVTAIAAVIASRLVGALAVLTLGRALGYERGVWAYAVLGLIAAWPGIALQLTVVPAAVLAVERTSILGPRWRVKS